MLKSFAKATLNSILSRHMPEPSQLETTAIQTLHERFRGLPSRADSAAEHAWQSHVARIQQLVLNGNPREFLRWDVIQYTMFVVLAPYTLTELIALRRSFDWSGRWRHAIRESHIGNPTPCLIWPSSSSNLIHHAYHALQFQQVTGARISDLDLVVEFGGGYGSMCRTFRNLGFRGLYVILDFPEFSALQEYYLTSLDIRVHSPHDALHSATDGATCVSNFEEAAAILDRNEKNTVAAFVGTWSLSECPLATRQRVSALIKDRVAYYLIGYQEHYGGVDNKSYFEDWQREHANADWHSWNIRHSPRDFYLIGMPHC